MPPRRSTRTASKRAQAAEASEEEEQVVTPPPAAKKAKAAAKTASRKRGLQGHAAPPSTPLGVVDSASGLKGAHILNRDGDVYDVMLSLVDISKNSDKYYLLQVIVSSSGSYHTWARWGRTGTAGQSQMWDAEGEEDAISIFEDKYKEKTGCEWSDHDNFEQQPGKYKLLSTDYVAVANKPPAMWQYYVDDGVDGKEEGWYDYDDDAAKIVEQLHDEWLYNQELATRLVDSGNWTYSVDLRQMIQTNTSTHKVRKIRRVLLSKGKGRGSRSAASTAAATPAAPSRTRGRAAAAAPAASPASPAPAGPPAKKSRGAAAAAAAAAPPATPPVAVKTRVTAAQVSVGAAAAAAGTGEVDPACPLASSGAYLHEDYDVMLNQTDISANKNKFYVAQLVCSGGQYYLWTRWGRVGESGATQMNGPMDLQDGIKEFKSKFRAKTGNNFDDRDNFVPQAGKYELISLAIKKEEEEEDVKPPMPAAAAARGGKVKIKDEPGTSSGPATCSLDPTTRSFIEFIFSDELFSGAMTSMELDISRMPLGRLSEAQVKRGMDVLEEIEEEIQGRARRAELQKLSSKFYQVVPHSFGRRVPPVIDSLDTVQQKFDLCNVLMDIEAAQQMVTSSGQAAVHPADAKYAELKADLTLVKPGTDEHKRITTYMKNTMSKGYHGKTSVRDVWRVDRHNESARFKAHDKLGNRKLLWHGTNAAVVAAILKSGLRIMPHSGGRVGSGIYLASESGKSVWYVRSGIAPGGKALGVMFLVEAALGKEASITRDDPSLKAPPKGFDCVVARGSQEPDPSQDEEITLDGKPVTVPLGVPKPVQQYSGSSFSNSEYLLYQESQHRIRYVMTVNMP
mmetsp:Transcript_19383/g.41946  ORF Transcript_19383/g.41946 Transcript_19383/m.41946 type:complete len:849 (-) Transcript_19383:893-3439(-)|eukprot:CAMPEP_0202890208 /NCGR_PEP_ID=MMETSP1392-20130828/705_1 /ASSEMBLY_ACC=CAM_ASM_000868 /TAXON_ID=225041 /ORGANISM="Chlamydomonas chlamydogama, Strain SAG 11-48b" /LENGTH=848 /DNA_ID=CAMNT_0049573745 /DNA_START=153 /DNA_END=2699 /DNA_ORIENTATION=+